MMRNGFNLDFWYGHTKGCVDRIDIAFYPNEGVYRGNMYCEGKMIGDYCCSGSVLLEKIFPRLKFDWGD